MKSQPPSPPNSSYSFKWLFLYISYGILAVPIFCVCCVLGLTGKIGFRNFYEKLGFQSPRSAGEITLSSAHVWIHVSSVGEWRTAVPLLKKLKHEQPTIKIALTYFNEEMSRLQTDATFCSLIDRHAFMSLENPLAVRRWIRLLKIRLLILVEAEFWPLLLLTTQALGVPIMLVSGILFEKEYRRFRRLKWIVRPVWRTFSGLAVISPIVADRFHALGVPRERLHLTGSLKLVETPPPPELAPTAQEKLKLCGKWLNADKRFVIFLASIHFKEFQRIFSALKSFFDSEHYSFIIAPRLVREERKKFLRFLREQALPAVIRTELTSSSLPVIQQRHLLLDTLGEAVHLMPQSHSVVVGGSYIPKGGHNVLEPLRLGLPTLVGPYHFHIEEQIRSFGEVLVVGEVSELKEEILKIEKHYGHRDSPARKKYTKHLGGKFKDLSGATERTFRQLSKFL